MSDVFISHVEEDASIALAIAQGLEAAGYTTWYYERDSVVGPLYLLQIGQAIEQSRAVVLIISPDSLASNQVTSEVVRAYESGKPFLPVLRDITHPEFQQRQPVWRQAVGASVAINLPPEGVTAILPRLIDGLMALGIRPKSKEAREAEAREQERAKKAAGLLTKADEAQSAESWDHAIALLKQTLELTPDDEMVQGRLREVQQQRRESQLEALRARARSLTKAEKWDEALTTWHEVLALEPEDRKAAQGEIQRVEKLQKMAQTYAEAKTAMATKEYERAADLLKGLIVQDPGYKDAARMLAKAVELARRGERFWQRKWLRRVVAGVAVVAVAFALTQLRHLWVPSELPVSSPVATIVTGTVSPSPSVVETAVLSLAEGATPIRPSELTPEVAIATPTHPPETTPTATTSTDRSTATSVSAIEPPTAAPVASPTVPGAPASRSILVPDEVVNQFFSPGPSPAALAVAGDYLWVVNDEPRMLHHLDRTGTPLASFPITPTGWISGLVWDGENLRLALRVGYPPVSEIVRLGPAGEVLESVPLPVSPVGLGWNPGDRTFWTVNGEFLLEFSADGRLLQTRHAPVSGGPGAFAWTPDGLWVVDANGTWYLFGFEGEQVSQTYLPEATWQSYDIELTWDEHDYLWLTVQSDRRIHQFALRQEEVQLKATPRKGGELALPRPTLKQASTADRAIAHVTNNLQGTVSLFFGDKSAILKPGETWSTELSEGVYMVFASASQPEPIAFSDKQLLIAGYDWTWVLDRPE